MKGNFEHSARPRTRFVRVTVLFVAVAAITLTGFWTHIARAQTDSATASPPGAPGASTERESGIEAMISHLHDTFKITAVQEPLWARVAAVMRENAATLTRLAKARSESSGHRTALDDLQSYAEISAAHAEGTKKLVPVFKALYASLSGAQKKAADTEFDEHYRAHTRHGN